MVCLQEKVFRVRLILVDFYCFDVVIICFASQARGRILLLHLLSLKIYLSQKNYKHKNTFAHDPFTLTLKISLHLAYYKGKKSLNYTFISTRIQIYFDEVDTFTCYESIAKSYGNFKWQVNFRILMTKI